MKKYNISGFSLVCKKLYTEHKKTQFIALGAFYGFLILVGAWLGMVGSRPQNDDIFFYILISGFVCAVCASRMFTDLSSKEGQISLLMTPASAVEKFIPRLLWALPGIIFVCLLGFYVFEICKVLGYYTIYDTWYDIPSILKDTNKREWSLAAALTAIFLFNESIFIFGAVAWPKKSFIKSMGIFVCLWIILSAIFATIVRIGGKTALVINEQLFTWGIIIFITLLACIITWLAFVKFKRITLK